MQPKKAIPKKVIKPIVNAVNDFMELESAGGLLLLLATIAAMVVANSPIDYLYDRFLDTTVALQFGDLEINKHLLHWINDGMMAIFFLLIGLEIKREFMEGELSSLSQIALPGFGALGGMVLPAAIYSVINWNNGAALNGWAIPVATDIAFALALLTAFGARVPTALKIFLLTLAIFDDLAAIVIIGIFYSSDLSLGALLVAGAALALAILMNISGVTRTSGYILVGVVLWVAVLKSGVHATLAGVLIALCIPMRDENDGSPVRDLENDLHTTVAYAILPLFAFANAGIAIVDVSWGNLINPVSIGVVAGLFIGKPLGILLFVWLALQLKLAKLPDKIDWLQLLGVAFACGIGFTMSLFIAGLAFEHGGGGYVRGDRLAIVVGSVLSAVAAYAVLSIALPKQSAKD